jgi:prepilin-type processing-associated H-X9-DG protein
MSENEESRICSFLARACPVLGLLGLVICLFTLADLPNRLRAPRSISAYAESDRTWKWYLVSLVVTLLAVAADYASRRATKSRRLRLVGLLCAAATAVIPFSGLTATGQPGWNRNSGSRALCINNLKQIELALFNYESAHGFFPPRVHRDRQGRPLLSWRVLILPYLDQYELFLRFHLDETWDSPHNRDLIGSMPSIFACPTQANWIRNQTVYQVLDGPGTFLDSSGPTRLSQLSDGPGQTIAIVESPVPVPWSSPEDFPFRTDQPFPGWEATHPGGINCSFVDGSVRFFKATIHESVLKALATRAGGERISPDSY